MNFVQIILTESQVELLTAATGNAMIASDDETEKQQLSSLLYFLDTVAQNPTAFPPSPQIARSIRKRISGFKGPAQPKPNKRKRAQLRAQGAQKRTRAEKRELALIFNQAREAALAVHELEQAQAERERIEGMGIVLPD